MMLVCTDDMARTVEYMFTVYCTSLHDCHPAAIAHTSPMEFIWIALCCRRRDMLTLMHSVKARRFVAMSCLAAKNQWLFLVPLKGGR